MPATRKPIRNGYCLSLTGPVAGNTRSVRLAHDTGREDANRRGGLLVRPAERVCDDDHADASRVADFGRRLMDEDKVDLVISGHGTGSLLSAMPVIMARRRFYLGLPGV